MVVRPSRFVRNRLCLALALVGLAGPAAAQINAPALADPNSALQLPPDLQLPDGTPGAAQRRLPILAPVSPSSMTKTALGLNALFAEGAEAIESGLKWRIFSDQPDVNGNHALVLETDDARPLVTLDPGGYIYHVSYGLVGVTRHVVLGSVAQTENIALNAGALSFSGTVAGQPIPPELLRFEIHKSGDPMETPIGEVRAGEIVRLPAGSYQVTSTYGDANARINSEIRVEAGKLTEAAVLHKAGHIHLSLKSGDNQEITDASWSILTPGGDVVSETLTNLKDIVLAEGEYVAVARYEGKIIQKPFEVAAGQSEQIDLTQN
ncbi:hypothetical protein [Terrihabitans sp. B22-R8]|uniref:hypothetical protein n=1 Tax=Terrihabitans sp. B22-R8 TaxID=3425128 RepID=UPI00403C2FE0